MLEVSDNDPNLPGSRRTPRRAEPTLADPLAIDTELPDTVDIPDRERPPVAVYLVLTVLTLAALGALLWYTNRNADAPVSTAPDVTAVDAEGSDAPAQADTTDPVPESSVGVRMDEAIPLISTAVDRCDKNGLLGTIVSSASSRVQLDLRLQFVDADGGVYYEAARATGAVDPSQAVTFTFLLLGEPVPDEFAGVDPASCRLEVTGVFGA